MACGSGGCSSGGCSSGGCNQVNVFDWLSGVVMPGDPFDAVEVKFKGGRKEYFRNVNNLELYTGDAVVIEAAPGHHIGHVSAQGEIVRLQMKKKKVAYNDNLKIIYRKVAERDFEKWELSKNRESVTLYRAREIIFDLKLGMKLSDVEYQADNTKATFYYSAEDRVDFRELIKLLAGEFKIRVEMKQISLRQEAGRLGGIGSCGRELCCSTWLNEFKSVSTSAARYQNLSLNPSKLSGQCGRLKCCLNYELETYMEALEGIPKLKKLRTEAGDALLQKTDIFKRIMWFSYPEDNDWYALPVDRVTEIMALNEKGEVPHSLELDELEIVPEETINSDIVKLDKKFKKKEAQASGNKKRRKNKNKNKPNEVTANQQSAKAKSEIKLEHRPENRPAKTEEHKQNRHKPANKPQSKPQVAVNQNQETKTNVGEQSAATTEKPRMKSKFKKRRNNDE